MAPSAQIVPLPTALAASDDYTFARARLEDVLLRHGLLASYDSFAAERKPYPFASLDALLPRAMAGTVEHKTQNTALVFLLDRTLPDGLNKHFRLRGSNRATWANIRRLAPDLDLSDYKTAQCEVADPGFADLLPKLAPLDYALMVERLADEDAGCAITHLHVKVERLTDNAIKHLAFKLGYIGRRLFERGEDYVDALEAKFYEYYGFPPNASGRKSAAAMAAQLFAEHHLRFTVFAVSQEDCRLCVLDETDRIVQYMLIRPDAEFRVGSTLAAPDGSGLAPFIVRRDGDEPVFVLRVVFRRTAAAMPLTGGRRRDDDDIQSDWLVIDELAVVMPDAGPRGRGAIVLGV